MEEIKRIDDIEKLKKEGNFPNELIEKIEDEWQLTYCYLNVPKAKVRERSAIHYGTALLCIENPEEIHGQYYTDRKTTGDMTFSPE